MNMELEAIKEELRLHGHEVNDEVADVLYAAGKTTGRNEAVDYIDHQIEAFMDLETRKYGADTTVEEFNKLLEAARNPSAK